MPDTTTSQQDLLDKLAAVEARLNQLAQANAAQAAEIQDLQGKAQAASSLEAQVLQRLTAMLEAANPPVQG